MNILRVVLVGVAALALALAAAAHAQTLLLTVNTPNPQASAEFGHSLAVGEVNGDGKADVAVGAPYEHVGGNDDQGRAYVFSGANGSVLFSLNTPNPQAYPVFDMSLAMGDVSGDGKADIVVGAPVEDVGSSTDQGRAYVFSGASGSLLFTLNTPNPQTDAQFGYSVAAGDVNGDGEADIAVGAQGETVGGNGWQGRAYVFSGGGGSLLLTLTTPNAQPDAWFGRSVAVGDVNGEAKGEIAVGASYEDVGGNVNQGRAYVFSSPALAPVGGVAHLPDMAGRPSSSAANYIALAGAAAALLALAAGGWYARRRWLG
jgi:hypothetical protein